MQILNVWKKGMAIKGKRRNTKNVWQMYHFHSRTVNVIVRVNVLREKKLSK